MEKYESHVPRPIIMKEDRGIHSFFRGFITMDVQVRGSTQNDEALAGSVCMCELHIATEGRDKEKCNLFIGV